MTTTERRNILLNAENKMSIKLNMQLSKKAMRCLAALSSVSLR